VISSPALPAASSSLSGPTLSAPPSGSSSPVPSGIDLGIEGLSDYRSIGSGGFSRVFSATDDAFNRKVAVKVLHDGDDTVRRWFERERSIMGQLSDHPNIITPFRTGLTSSGAPYLVMEYVTGGSLADLLEEKGLIQWRDAIDHLLPVCDALGYAHEHGILHKDVKPANILLARHSAKLTDFGIASLREGTTSETAFTLAHCPPEAFADGSDRREERSDLYSFASTLHNLIAGQPPFEVDGPDSQPAYMNRIADTLPPSLPAALAPGWLRDLVLTSLAKDLSRRPGSMTDLGRLLRSEGATRP
jgi:serine/threonine protein kinase